MKKAKIFLGAIAVLAVVGGALAFKAKTLSNGFIVYTCVTPQEGIPVCSFSGDEIGGPLLFTNVGFGRVRVTQATSDPLADGSPCILSCTDNFIVTIKPGD